MTETTAVPEQTALQLAQGERDQVMGALAAAVDMLQDQRRRWPYGLTVDDQAILDGLVMLQTVLPLLMGYASEVQTQRDVLAARLAGDDSDTTAANLLSYAIGMVADCQVPGVTPTPPAAPSSGVVLSVSIGSDAPYKAGWAAGWSAGWQAGDLARAQRVQGRTADHLA